MKKLNVTGMVLVVLLNCGLLSAETVTITKEMVSVDTTNRKYYPVMSKVILDNAEHPDIKSTINTLSQMDDSYILDFVQTARAYGANYVIDMKRLKEKMANGTGLKIDSVKIQDVSAEQFKAMAAFSVADGDYNIIEEVRDDLPDIDFCNRSDIPGFFWHFINGYEMYIKDENDQDIIVMLFPYQAYGDSRFLLFGFMYTIE